MAYSITGQGGTTKAYLIEAMCDNLVDIDTLPSEEEEWPAGSYCIVLEDSSVWMLGTDRVWHLI